MRLCGSFIVLACLCYCASADLYFTTIPGSIKLRESNKVFDTDELSNVVNFLIGLSSQKANSWDGVERLDLFNTPKANLLIDLRLPQGAEFTLKEFVTRYSTAGNSPLSIDDTSSAIYHTFNDEQKHPMCFQLDRVGDNFYLSGSNFKIQVDSETTFHPDMLVSIETLKKRLLTPSSVLSKLQPLTCLNMTNKPDLIFLLELQSLMELLDELKKDTSSVTKDSLPDNFQLTLTSLQNLEQTYGLQSCQVEKAIEILESFIPEFILSMNELYSGGLLSEVNIAGPREREFQVVRKKRATGDIKMAGIVEPTMTEYAVYINLGIWVSVIFALASLASSYYIWFMDPGKDNIVYRMTSRLKTD